jgi:hypothetical protein
MRTFLKALLSFVDRDVARWNGHPLATVLIACMPMVLWAVLTGEAPTHASGIALSVMLTPPVVLGTIGVWRGCRYLWSEHKRMRALGASEDLDD